MIQRYFKIAAPSDEIRQAMLAFETWPEWWPGVQTVKVLQTDQEKPVVALVIKTVATIQMTLQFDCRDVNAIRFRQTKGWFKSYQGEYMLLPAPDGTGTTVKITTELESGMMVPKSMVYTKLSATLGLLEGALNARLRASSGRPLPIGDAKPRAVAAARPQEKPKPVVPRRKLGQIFSTPDGLEVWVAGRPYLLRPVTR